jgi:uncharacterized protein (TIGR02217 family)
MAELPFAEILFNLGFDFGCIGGPRFSNTKIEVGNGYKQTNIDWDAPLGRWQVGDRSGPTALTQTEATYLSNFFWARKGSAQPFRYRDWADHSGQNEPIGVGDGIRKTYPLIKTYGDEFGSTVRVISKPVLEGFSVAVESEQPLNATLNTTNGLIAFDLPPESGALITATYDFHVPVTFEQDALDLRFAYWDSEKETGFFDLGALSVVEERTEVAV